ncbi:type II secretion system F family protein [Streptomyces sp. NPDC053755]|uniref:type II secretion system F family protein n=1 Tax=Streptomyces sp. NPDC053755 TaxID=3155815 RepID=UPI0034225001
MAGPWAGVLVAGEFGGFVHRLGAALLVAGALVGSGTALAERRRGRRTRKRLAALLGAGFATGRPRRTGLPTWSRTWAAPLAAAGLGYALFGGGVGCLVALGAAYGARRWSARRAATADEAEEVVRQLPLAADLLAACASAGAGPGEAAEAVGRSLGGPVGERLARTAAELRLGGEPAEVWRRFGAIPGAGGLARCLERAGSSGAPAAEAIARQAAGLRAEHARRAATRAQRAQVLITAPVGLCFLPAFLAVGVAPVVVGLATGLLRS